MDANTLRYERIGLFKNAITGKERNQRIPHFGNLWSWKIADAGLVLSETLHDYDKLEQALRHTYQSYRLDAIYENGWRNPVQVTEFLGSNAYVFDDAINSIHIDDQCYMEPEDYDALISNPKKFLWETFVPRKYKKMQEHPNSGVFLEFIKKYGELGDFLGKIVDVSRSYGLADMTDLDGPADPWGNGYELLFCSLRGMKGLAMDLRRIPDKVEAAVEALDETFAIPRLEWAKKAGKNGTNPEFCFDINPVLLGHITLSPKQFERFYWPHLKRTVAAAEEMDKLVYIFAEGDSQRFWDFFQEFPENRVALHCELNDIFEQKKMLSNITPAGGMPISLLGNATPDECVAYAKKLIDEIGSDGRYIFSEDKMISFKSDCKSENLKAVCDFVSDYRI